LVVGCSTAPELEQLRGISDELGSTGGFRRIGEVVGAAALGRRHATTVRT
jgi:hypothetical protein